jgi:hypothetical protein
MCSENNLLLMYLVSLPLQYHIDSNLQALELNILF